MRCEDVGRARETRGELARLAVIAAPELAHRIAIAVVPLAPSCRESAQAVSAGTHVPRLGDELQVAQCGILRDGLQQWCGCVEPSFAPGQCRGEVEAKAIDAG